MLERRPQGLFGFYVVSLGQFVSIVGTSMTQFALTIWSWKFVTEVQPMSDPATAMALVGIANFLPQVVLSPVAGALVDRWNRKLTMMLVDLAAGLATIAVFLLYNSGQLHIWHLYVAGAFTGIFQSFHFPAYSAAIATMVPKAHYERANAVLSLTESLSTIFAPFLATFLLTLIGISGVMLIDIITFTAAVGALALVIVPQPEATHEGRSRGSLWRDSLYGFQYIVQRPSLLGLQMVFFFGNFLHGAFGALHAPFILSRTNNDTTVLATVQVALSVGMVLGGIVIARWGGLRRRVDGVLGGWIISSLPGMALFGLGQSLPVWIAGVFVLGISGVLINSSNQAIWQAKVPPDLQGRVFGARRLIAQIIGPIGLLAAGQLADRVFGPGMQPGGALTPLFGGLMGTGMAAGLGLLIVVFGVLAGLVGLAGYFVPAIRNAETVLPDHDARTASTALTADEALRPADQPL
jgi:MFS family permease